MPEYPFAIEKMARKKWLGLHYDAEHVSASQVGTIMNLNEYESPEMLWAVRSGKVKSDREETPAMMMGHAAEKVIASLFKQQTKKKVYNPAGEYGIVRHPQFPWLFCTLDRVVVEDGAYVPLELKNTGKWDAFGEDTIPLAHELQLQVQMACTEASYGYLAVLVGNQRFMWYEREYRADIMGQVLAACQEFRQFIADDERPPMDYSNESTQEMIKRMHSEDNGESVPIPMGADRLIEEIWDWSEKEKEAKKEVSKRKSQLADWIGENTYGTTAGGRKVSYKTTTKKEHMVKATSYRTIRVPSKPKDK